LAFQPVGESTATGHKALQGAPAHIEIADYQFLNLAARCLREYDARIISVTDELDLVVTANMLRTAIRAKLGSGTTQRAISGLIADYARDDTHIRRREEGGVQ